MEERLLAAPLLRTKLYIPPLRPHLVSRPRLIRWLDEGLRMGRRWTLVSAPAGFGKTTLVSAWLQPPSTPDAADRSASQARAFAWLSLDAGDNDLARFFTYLVAALQKAGEGVGQSVQNMLEAPQLPPAESLLTALINDIAAAAFPLLLVMDDYHTITELAVHEAVEFLLERLPPQVHVAIITRHDPPLALSRFRGRGQVTEVRQGDLRFTPEEAATFLNQSMNLGLSASEIAALEGRTEGWIAGLQLAALSMQGRDAESTAQFIAGFSGRYHFILDYLTDEVLRRQPEPVQRFLLQTCILERMCGPLCDAVMDSETEQRAPSVAPLPSPPSDLDSPLLGQSILEHLQHANLFLVPLDDERKWYRYHHLFAELLRGRLQESQPHQVPELHRRAATWFEQNGLDLEAIHHALATKDFMLAADVIGRAINKISAWSRTDVATLLGWLTALPDDVMRSRPWLRLYHSRMLFATGQWEVTKQILQELEQWLQDNPTVPDTEDVSRLVIADWASYAVVRGEIRQAADFAHRLLARIPKDDAIGQIRGISILGMAHSRAGDVSKAHRAFSQAIDIALAADMGFIAVPFLCNLVDIQIAQGQLGRAIQTSERAMQQGIVDGVRLPVVGFVGLGLGKILYERNDLRAAEGHLLDGIELLSRGGIGEVFGNMHAVLAQVKQAQGDDEGAQTVSQKAVQIAQRGNIPRLVILTSAYQARVWLTQGKLDLAARWAHDYRGIGATEYLREFEDLTLARVLLAQGEPDETLTLLEAMLIPAEAARRMGCVIEILALRALAFQALGDMSRALDALGQALKLAQPEGYVRVFLDEGEPMATLLRQAASRGIVPEYASRLLAAFETPARDERPEVGETSSPVVRPSLLVEPLTDREIEVLLLLAEGFSNSEIAQQLFISLPTVKSHTRNIYGKLGVHSRKQAVAQARTLGILPPL
jgi:LuxR family maltose regulon positive regulatory protein